MPQLSIITINFNNAEGLRKTIKSVIDQAVKDFEYIVIDGGSTDGSLDYIKQNSEAINHWISEKDNGVYNAMNKGWKKATGQYCLFLNSGDYFENDRVIGSMLPHLNDYDLVYGDLILAKKDKLINAVSYPKYTLFDLVYTSLPHPATFIKRQLLEDLRGFDESFKVVSDWFFFMQAMIEKNCTMKHVPIFVSVFDLSGVSHSGVSHNEHIEAIRKKYPFMEAVFAEFKELRRYKLSSSHRLLERIISRIR